MSVKLNESQIKYLGINKKNDLNYNLEINGTTHTNGRIYSDEWIQFNETAKGLYWPNGNNTHLYPNNVGSYGSLIIMGDRGGYNGILLGDTQDYMVVMSSPEHQGLFNQANNKWIVYYNKTNGRIGIGTSTLQGYNNTISGSTYVDGPIYSNTAFTLTAGKVAGFPKGHAGFYGNGIAISNPATANDMGWIRMTGTGESDSILEIAVGDDGGGTGAESVVVRQYNTNNAIVKEAYLLNPSGNTSFPGTITAPTFSGTATHATADAAGNVITSKYVAVDTTQTISGAKTFTAATRINNQLTINTSLQDHNTPTTQCLVLNSNGLTDTITEVTDKNAPGIGFHIGNVSWGSLIFSNTGFKFINNSATGYMNVTAAKFIGALQGNADTATVLQTARTLTIGNTGKSFNGGSNVTWSLSEIAGNNYFVFAKPSVSTGTMNDAAKFYNAMGMICLTNPTSGTATNVNPNGGTGWHHFINLSYADGGAGSNSWITQIANPAGTTDLWVRSRSGGTISDSKAWVAPWTRIVTGSNFTSVLNGTYINTSGDTMTGALNFKNSTWNLLGDDVYFGDNDTAGSFAIKGANGNTNFKMVTYNGTSYGTITWNGSSFTFSNSVVIGSGAHYYMTYNSGAYYVLHNHNNGNISLNAASGGLYIGYFNTDSLNFGPEAQWGYVTASSGWVFSLGMTAANVTSNGRAYMNEWIQFNTNNGLYWPNHYSIHICGNDVSTYGGVRIRGAKGGYHGIICGDSSIHLNIMSSDEHQGLFNESNSRWIVHYSRSNNIMSLGGSDVSAGYTVNVNGSLYASSSAYIAGALGSGTRIYTGYDSGIASSVSCSNWFRSSGDTGWFNASYGGGWYQTDTTYIRTYGTFQVYSPGRYLAGDIPSSWLNGLKNQAAYRINACSDSDSYHPWIQQTNSGSGYCFSLGMLGTSFYMIGCPTSQTANSYTASLVFNVSNGYLTGPSRVYGAVWNDYAEYRSQAEILKPGQVTYCDNDGKLKLTTSRMQKFEGVVSDTYGFAIGETDSAKTPLAVSGRVLVYTYEDRSTFNSGDCVCAAPDGQVSKMTREEIAYYPDRIVGVVSEIPDYEVWGTGNIDVDNRIWIKVK